MPTFPGFPTTDNAPPRLLLAPMEGLLDFKLRDALTRCGGVDACVSEFIRVTDRLLPQRVFTRTVPELLQGGCTTAGVPVVVQLLGSDPACLADNAVQLAQLAPAGIDLNFGCPARTVNRHRGGAVLLDEPELVGAIVAAVRRAVPAPIPVSAKMRLGYRDDRPALDCALAIEAGGANSLVIHARTKADGYRPPAYWERIAPIRERLRIPVVANGEIWTLSDAQRCRAQSGCKHLMLGRGMTANPGLALVIAAQDRGLSPHPGVPWSEVLALLSVFWNLVVRWVPPRHQVGRAKQWLNQLRRQYPEAEQACAELRLLRDPAELGLWLQRNRPDD